MEFCIGKAGIHRQRSFDEFGTSGCFRRRTVVLLALANLLIAGVMGCKSAPEFTPQEAEGKHLYSVRCAHCHEDNDLGLKKAPPDLHHVFARTKLPSGAPATDMEVRRVVLSGKGMMPSFAGRFTDEQMASLLAYLHMGLS
jgi:mono/diheme cytochrome c family protein